MKGPLILVLISALIATPLFADTITLKNGQIYEGEILEETSDYIRLKTDSKVLKIRRSSIAKITAPEVEVEVEVEAEEPPRQPLLNPVAQAEAAAEAEVHKMLWFGVGCALNFVGVFVASSVKPSPPGSHLIGKSPEYVKAFIYAYQQKAKSIQRERAIAGCKVGTLLGCPLGCWIIFLVVKKASDDLKKGLDPGCAAN